MTTNYLELIHVLLPEAALVIGALVVLGVDLTAGRGKALAPRTHLACGLGVVALVIAGYLATRAGNGGEILGGVFILDPLALATRLGVLLLAGLTLALIPRATPLNQPAEYVTLLLLATVGFSLMAISQQLLIAFLALELASLSLYVLAGFDKSRPESAEAALKYFLFGGMSAAFLLFGFSLIYGLTGAITFPAIAAELGQQGGSTLLLVALVMIIVSFGFKAAAAPFHLWAPDVYQGAPLPSAALIASASKLAGFILFTRMLWSSVGPAAGSVSTLDTLPGWLPVIALLALASLLLGNIAALAQTNVRRLLAYSAIAHAGGLLLGVMAAGRLGPAPLFYYAATYGLATVGAFGVIAVIDNSGGCHRITDLAGLHKRSPLLAICLVIFVLSLAGIPPLAGFFGKFAVYSAALKISGMSGIIGWLTLLAIGLSAVALYYYLIVLKQAVISAPAEGFVRIRVGVSAGTALAIVAVLLVVLGLFPSYVLRLIG